MVNDVGESLQRERCLLEVLPERCQTQERARDISRQDAKGNQLTQGELTLEHHGGTDAQDDQSRELLKELAGRASCCTRQGVAKTSLNLAAIELLPSPAAV